MKKLLLSFMLILSTALVASEKVELFKDNKINATHFSSAVITKTIEGEKIDIKLIVGHNLFGKISSVTIETAETKISNDESSIIDISASKRNIAKLILDYRHDKVNGFLFLKEAPEDSCFKKCYKTWCSQTTTEAGTVVCSADCIIEYHML